MFDRLSTLARQEDQPNLLFLDVLQVPASLMVSKAVVAGQVPDAVTIRFDGRR